jgi:hypothetical protein
VVPGNSKKKLTLMLVMSFLSDYYKRIHGVYFTSLMATGVVYFMSLTATGEYVEVHQPSHVKGSSPPSSTSCFV